MNNFNLSKLLCLDVILVKLYISCIPLFIPLCDYLHDWFVLLYIILIDYMPSLDFNIGDEIFTI